MTANLDRLKQATEQFLIRMLPQDKAQVGAFSDKIQFSGTFTSDRDDLIGALRDLQFGNPTRLYDATYESIDVLGDHDGRKVRRGVHRRRRHGEPARASATRSTARATKEVMIYSIGLRVGVLQRRAAWSARSPIAACGSWRRKPAAATSS